MSEIVTVTVKGVGDFSDVVSNVGAVQKALTKLKLPDKLGDNLNKNISNFMKEYEKYQNKISEGIKTQGDYNQVEKSLNKMRSLYQEIGQDAQKLTQLDMKDMFDLDVGEFKKISNALTDIIKQIGNTKIDTSTFTKAFDDIRKITKSNKVTGDNGILNQMIGHINTGQISEAKRQLQELQAYAKKVAPRTTAEGKQAPGTLSVEKYNQLTAAITAMGAAFDKADAEMAPLIEEQNKLQKELEETKQKAAQSVGDEFDKYNQASKDVDSVTESLKRMHQEEFSFSRETQNIDRQIQSYFGLSQMIRKVGDIAKDAFQTVKELDKAMTETAVVTNFSVGDMWEMLPTYTKQANQLGSTIKDVYEAATLYYQQGLNTNQAMSLANETLKMARIAGLDAAEATNMMTAALRGFNMEINQQSAQKINDIYSELAAITASDTKEIGSAMERTASIANSANMEFATTSAFLAQMIETTREAPENLGTAMKTIVARFQEMKQDPTKLVDSEGVAMDANKVDKALKTIGVQLMNTKGEFRDLDDVFLDISAKWDSLTQGQQRYIATIAAGSRQQSRFIAMMSNYERTMELVDAANNSAGASQRQFEKTLDSMEAKLNKLKNAWDQFTMGLMNNQILKFGVDTLTEGFTIVNKFIDLLSKIPPKPFEGVTKSVLTLVTTLGMLNFGKKATRGLVTGGAGWFKGETSLIGGFKEGWGKSAQTGFFRNKQNTVEAEQQGIKDGQAYGRGWEKAVKMLQTKQKTGEGILSQSLGLEQFKKNKAAFGSNDAIISSLFPKGGLDDEAKRDAQDYLNTLRQELANGKITKEQLPTLIESGLGQTKGFDNTYIDDVAKGLSDKKVKAIGTGFSGLTSQINSAGVALSNFGMILQGTPLEPFGRILTTVGTSLISLSTVLATTKASFLEQWAAATAAAMGTEAEGVAAMTTAAANGTLTVSSITAAGGMATLAAAVWAALWPLLLIAAAIGSVVLIAKGLDAAFETNKEKLEAASDAAAAASEAYDSAKQETSELADAIEQIKTNEDAFDGLVVGTAAFNEQLVTANDQIMELIKKYPMLNEYLTTDKNGVMHISDEGLNAVKEYQKQLQARASALNILQNADLNAEENRQKAADLRKVRGSMTQKEHDQNLQEAELLEQRIEAENESAKLAAVNTALVDKELGNQEKVAEILADQYNTRKSMVKLEGDKHDLRQQYAEFYGYNYNRSTKKMTDIEGNEIEINDKVIKDALKDITVLADLEVDAGSVDTAISSVDKKFSQHFKDNSFFSDILSNNIETNEDLLRDLLQNPDKLQDAVSELSTKELAAIMGVSADAVEMAPDKYSKQLINKLTEKAENIAESQAEAWGDFGVMLARAEGISADGFARAGTLAIDHIQKQFANYTSEQRDLMLSIGKSLESGAGIESMKTFIRDASEIYREGAEDTVTELNGIIEGVNWDSPIARLKAYKDLASATAPKIQKMGRELLESADSANLLGEAFEEFYNSSDWAEVAENMDNFVDSTGKINAAGVEEMAQQCHSLNNLLDTGAISAGGVAAAINALGSDGELTLLDLNSAVLQLLSSFGQLDDIIGQAHNSIENFDWGIDTGESADFVKEGAEKWNELYEGGEIGNPQLEAYAKYVLGEEKYIDLLASHSGDLQATMDEVSTYVNEYADGFDKAWDSLANGEWQGKVPKELQNLGISFDYNEGTWEWNPGSATTEQLSEWLQAVKGIGPEMAAAMIEDWQNYSPDFRAERQKNDFYAGLDNYISTRTGENGVTVTTEELNTIAAATGQSYEEVRDAIVKAAEDTGQKLTEIDNTVEGITPEELNTQYNQSKTGDANKSWVEQLVKTEGGARQVDASTAITQAIGDGFSKNEAQNMAYEELAKLAENTEIWYKDKLLTAEDLADFNSFVNAINSFEESSQWVEIGKAIAEGVVSYLEGKEAPNTNTDTNESSTTASTVIKPGQQGDRYTDTGTRGGSTGLELRGPDELTWQDKVPGWVTKLIEIYNNPPDTKTEPTELTPAQYQKMYGEPQQTADDEANASLLESSTAMESAATTLSESGTNLSQASSDLSSSAKELSSAAKQLTPPKTPGGTFTSGTVQTGTPQEATGNLDIDTTQGANNLDSLKAKVDEVVAKINEGATFTIDVSGDYRLNKAAEAAAKLKENAGAQTVGVSTSFNSDSVSSGIASINKTTATVNVTANTRTAETKVNSLVNSINSKSATIDISPNFSNTSWTHDVTINVKKVYTSRTGAYGINNKIPYTAPPTFGSLAKGTKSRYGQVGPNNRGGLTLTGEKGFEIAWLPSENRSMILGADGPQMLNLPADAVVYTHEQSKDILKRKSIPAGSHSKSTRPSAGGDGGGDDGISTIVNTAKQTGNNLSKNAEDTAKAIARVTVWWENAARRAEAIQRKIDKNQKTYEAYLKKVQATLKTTGTKGKGNAFIANTSNYIVEQQRQLNKAKNELKQINTGRWTSGKNKGQKAGATKSNFKKGAENVLQVSYKKGNQETTNYVNTKDYIYKKNGAYQISQKKLNQIDNIEKRKAVKEALEKELNDRISKKNKATDEIAKAKEQLDKFGEELYNTFFAWETSLTAIWNITQKIDAATAKLERTDTARGLLNAQLASGLKQSDASSRQEELKTFQQRLQQQNNIVREREKAITQAQKDVSKALGKSDEQKQIKNITAKLKADEKVKADIENKALLKEQKKLENKKKKTKEDKQRIKAIKAQVKKNNSIIGSEKELTDAQKLVGKKGLNETQILGFKEQRKQLKNQKAIIDMAQSFMTTTRYADGTVGIDFDTEKFERAKQKGNISEDTAKAIEDYVNGIKEANDNLNDLINNLGNDLTDYYNTLADLKDQWADYEDQLIQINEESNKKELDNLKKLSDSVKQAMDDLLKEVKRRLDERRQQTDNAKTERDITQKQQRLAALRADTSGGHQVEIARLEQEIAEAQENYQRSLEDQLLDKLQQQADEASRQRERQIQLQEELLTSTNNIAQVEMWMSMASDPNLTEEERAQLKEEIKQVYREANDYEKHGQAGQERIDTEFETFFNGLSTNREEVSNLTTAIESLESTIKNFEALQKAATIEDFETKRQAVEKSLTDAKNNEKTKKDDLTAANKRVTQAEALVKSGQNRLNTELTNLNGINNAIANLDAKLKKTTNARQREVLLSQRAQLIGQRKNAESKVAAARASLDSYQNNLTEALKARDKAKTAADNATATVTKLTQDLQTITTTIEGLKEQLANLKFASGGLNTQTGPAWLDGTPSKPELVLNSTDTKNFLMLKDVLASAMSGMGEVSNNYGGNATYEININVDKLTSDYDVDKVAERVKKIIVKDSSYRNVTQVRNLR